MNKLILVLAFLSIPPQIVIPVDTDPQVSYEEYNAQYFNDALPKDTKVFFSNHMPPDTMGLTLCADDGYGCTITLSQKVKFSSKLWSIVELHEMCHIETWNVVEKPHGLFWKTCMKRLRDNGAYDDLL